MTALLLLLVYLGVAMVLVGCARHVDDVERERDEYMTDLERRMRGLR